MTKMFSALLAGTALALAAAPAIADVKSGVDAWDSGNYAGAVKEWRPMAVKGDADAQYNMAQAYRFGRGVPADMKMAEDWYRKAAYQGHEQAEDALGLVMFQNGDRANAIPYLKRSADRGEARAQFVYGSVLFNGDVAGKDWPRAYGYMTRSSSSGFAKASSALAQMDQVMPLDQRQQGLQIAQEIETNVIRARTSGQMAMATPLPAGPVRAREIAPPLPAPSLPSAPGWDMQAPTASVAAPVQSGIRKEVLPPSSAGSMPMRRGTSALPAPPTTRDRAADRKKDVPEITTELPPAPAIPDESGAQFPAFPGGDFPGSTGVDSGGGGSYPGASYPGAAPTTAGGSYPGAAYPSSGAGSYPGSSYPAMPAEPAGSSYPSYPSYPMESAPAPVSAPPAVKSAPAYSSGTWRIQLGAFSEAGRAEAHGNSLRSRIAALNGKQFYKVTAGSFTRLQAGGYGSRAEADSACASVRSTGNACVVVVK